jgi:hypothetical protein
LKSSKCSRSEASRLVGRLWPRYYFLEKSSCLNVEGRDKPFKEREEQATVAMCDVVELEKELKSGSEILVAEPTTWLSKSLTCSVLHLLTISSD